MSSPITLSNFNSIDFSALLNAVMTQASQPLTTLQNKKSDLLAENSEFNSFAMKIGTLETAAAGLSTLVGVQQNTPTLSEAGEIAVSATGDAIAGSYDVKVDHLAKAQVTASSSTAADADTTTVATGGSITIGGVQVNVTGAVTLHGLATAINGTANIGVNASVVQSAPNQYRLVLTGKDTGLANAFTVTNGLTGSVAFADPNKLEADDAALTINGLAITSSSNTLESAIPGTTLSLLHADNTKTITVTVKPDDDSVTKDVQSFITAYNDLIAYMKDQVTQASSGTAGTIGRESILAQLRGTMRSVLSAAYGSGAFAHLAEVGIGFNKTGQLTLDKNTFTSALNQDRSAVQSLFVGSNTVNNFTDGAFGSLQSALDEFTRAGGFVSAVQIQLNSQSSRLDKQISDLQARLAVQRAALQQQYIAADTAMSQLKASSGSLASAASAGLVQNS